MSATPPYRRRAPHPLLGSLLLAGVALLPATYAQAATANETDGATRSLYRLCGDASFDTRDPGVLRQFGITQVRGVMKGATAGSAGAGSARAVQTVMPAVARAARER